MAFTASNMAMCTMASVRLDRRTTTYGGLFIPQRHHVGTGRAGSARAIAITRHKDDGRIESPRSLLSNGGGKRRSKLARRFSAAGDVEGPGEVESGFRLHDPQPMARD